MKGRRGRKTNFTQFLKKRIFEFSQRSIRDLTDWSKIVWSDEKKFNLDGSDGIRYYWHDLGSEPYYMSRRAFGGGTLMVWGAFVGNKLLDLVIVDQTMDSAKYTDMINKSLRPFMKRGLTFMHDGASIHRSDETKNWLKDNKIPVLEWPAISPDLNPIENVWVMLTRAVFTNGRQFKTKKELKAEVLKQWSLIKPEQLTNLLKSMTERIVEVTANQGGNTKY